MPCLPALAQQRVRAWQGKLDLPTYALGEEDPNPPFPLLKGSHVYPYTMLDDLTDHRTAQSYTAVFLENEYLKATVLPSLGGRLYSLYDKVAGREVFYRNNVVKYGLVGLRGAWISGGVEFNFPDGHTVVTVSPVAWTIEHGSDGSARVVVGDIDRVTGMHWEVTLALHPGDARLEQHVTLFNSTPATHRYWYWANAAVRASADMQFIYPMREAYPHARWPVFTYPVYQGVDYSWYKNVRQPTSLFGRQVHRDFFGACYHDADYGVVHVADFREEPGKKTWTWGVAGDGLIWTDLLTDHDGPYNEIQSGRYETQLNYEFMAPHRVESWTEYWYPVRGLRGGFVAAEKDLALNVDYVPAAGQAGGEPHVELLISPTVALSGVTLQVKLGSELLREFKVVQLKPLGVTRFEAPVKDLDAARKALVVEVQSRGSTLVHWSAAEPVDGNTDFVPAAGAPKPPPIDLTKMTVEEQFLYGVSQEKDGQEVAAQATFAAVLARDPGYVPALLKQAWSDYLAADFLAAQQSIARALARNNASPDAHYTAGVIYRATGRLALAADAFWASIHFGGAEGRAFVQLGELAIVEKHYFQAANLLRRALRHNPDDALALADLAVALRLAGKSAEAAEAAQQAVRLMPLLPMAVAEASVTFVRRGGAWRPQLAPPALAAIHCPNVEDYVDAADWYRSLGDDRSADGLLGEAVKSLPARSLSPLVDYTLASDARSEGKTGEAERFAARGAAAPYAKVFPQRVSDAVVLADAIAHHPLDAHAQYYLGNFLFAHGRYDGAAKLWLSALGAGFDSSVLERNLGVYAWRVSKDLKAATAYYQKAVSLAPDDYRLYLDLDEILSELGDITRRSQLLEQAPAAVRDRDTLRARRALLLVEQRRYHEALAALAGHAFKPWEGGEVVRRIYVAAGIGEGRARLRGGDAHVAEESFRRALDYPVNLGVGKPDHPHDEAALYWLGEALATEGKSGAAHDAWQQVISEDRAVGPFGRESSGESQFYAALSLDKLGQTEQANAILDKLLTAATRADANAPELYVAGLVEESRQHADQAHQDFERALKIDPTFWQARAEL
ncbi:MAG TPA: DUF5107 domain-containing protein [Terriglobia bacterium]|nr:DUF5107 domain-containing protein [Terriglobia bacterium]